MVGAVTLEDVQAAERSIKTDDPSEALQFLGEYVEGILPADLASGKESAIYFVEKSLYNIVMWLLNRSDPEDELDTRIFHFLDLVLAFSAKHMKGRLDVFLPIVDEIFSENEHTFYSHSTCLNACEDMADADDVAEDAFEDEAFFQHTIFAESSQVDSPFRGAASWIVTMINTFGRNGGFKVIRDELLAENMPVAHIKILLRPLYKIKDFLTGEFLNWFFVVYEMAAKQVLVMSDDDLKNEFKNASDVVMYMCALFRYASRSDAMEALDILRLTFALRCFRSPFLERRLGGLTDICNVMDEVHNSMHRQLCGKCTDDKPWVTMEYILDWLAKNDILASIFARNIHVEVLKRCSKLLKYLAYYQRVGQAELEVIWSASLGKHESIQKTVLELMCSMVQVLSADSLERLLGIIDLLKPSEYTMPLVTLIRFIALQLATKLAHLEPKRQLAGVDMLWRLSQDDVRFSQPELHLTCVNVIIEAIEFINTPELRSHLFREAINNLKSHRSVAQCVFILLRIFFSLKAGRAGKGIDWSSLEVVKDEQEFVALVIDDIVHFQNSAISAVTSSPQLQASQLDSLVIQGHYSLTQHQEKRLHLLHQALDFPGAKLTIEQVDVLWRTLVLNALTEKQRNYVYHWFELLVNSPSTRVAAVGSCEYIFMNLLCKSDLKGMNEGAFAMFRTYFRMINFSMDVDTSQRVAGEKYRGIPQLWEIAVHAVSEQVATLAIVFLNQLYQHLSQEAGRLVERREEYISTCMRHLLMAAESACVSAEDVAANEKRVFRCIRLLTTFLNGSEAVLRQTNSFDVSKHGLRLRGEQLSIRIQRVGSQGECPVIATYANLTMHQLRMEIGKVLGEDARSLRLVAKGSEFCVRDDAKTVKEAKLSNGDVVHVQVRQVPSAEAQSNPDKVDESLVPHCILSRDYFHKLFQLLDGPPSIASQVWELLMILPTNKDLLREISESATSLEKRLSTSQSVYSLWYSLQIVESLMEGSSEPATSTDVCMGDSSWNILVEGGALELLKRILMSDHLLTVDSLHSCACMSLLLKVLLSIVSKPLAGEESQTPSGGSDAGLGGLQRLCQDEDQVACVVHRLMRMVQSSAMAVGGLQCGSSGEQLDHSRESVAYYAMRLLDTCASLSSQVFVCIYSFPHVKEWVCDVLLRCKSDAIKEDVSKGLVSISAPTERTMSLCFELGRGEHWHANAQRAAKRRRTSDDDMSESSVEALDVVQHPLAFLLDMLLPLTCEVHAPEALCKASANVSGMFELVNNLLAKTHTMCAMLAQSTNQSAADILDKSFGSNLDATARQLVKLLRTRPVIEDRARHEEDHVLHGTLVMVKSLIKLRPLLAPDLVTDVDGKSLVEYLYMDCLFDAPGLDNHASDGPPKCKMANTRKACFELLFELVRGSKQAYHELLRAVLRMHSVPETRSLHLYQPSQLDKSSCGFVGLHNLGATCYMNSLLQQLYHIPEFRASILKVPVEGKGKEDDDLMYQLQSLFAYLQESEKQFYETRDLCQAYRDYDGQPLNTSQQMDVDEYFNILFEKLEKGIQGTEQEKLLQECFGGKVVNQIICKEPVRVGDRVYDGAEPFKSQREETFYTLQLEVKHKRNILESLDLFVEGEMLEGDNKYFCEEADQKVDALKRLCISKLPKSLILHLKRFEFDLDFMKKVKVNDSCEFPTLLDMDRYTLDGIERREKAGAEALKMGLDPAKAVEQVESAPGSLYELVGVLVHTGTADSGHYYSYIKDRGGWQDEGERKVRTHDGKWYLFNDTIVERFDDREIGNACYGGSDYMQSTDGEQRTEYVPRMYNAYMLFYERVGTKGRDSRTRADVPEGILQRVWSENIQFLKDKQVYDQVYFSFLHQVALFATDRNKSCAEALIPMENLQDRNTVDQVLEMPVRFLMDVLVHSWDTAQVGSWVTLITSLLTEDEAGLQRCRWLLKMLTADVHTPSHDAVHTSHWLRWAVVNCKVQEVRVQLVSLIVHACRTLSEHEPAALGDSVRGIVPHCAPQASSKHRNARPEQDEVYLPLYKDKPLLTDVLLPRLYPGGTDDSLQPPFDYLPFPRAITTVGMLIDKVLDLLPDVPANWRHFAQYFQLLADIAKIGPAEKAFLLSRRAVSRCIDIFLHDESPFAEYHSYKGRLGDKFAQPNMEGMVEMIADLLCSATLPTAQGDAQGEAAEQQPQSPWQMPTVGALDPACADFVFNDKFISKLLAYEAALPATKRLLLHMSWGDTARSLKVVHNLVEAVEEACDETMMPLLDIFTNFCSLHDGIQQRVEKSMGPLVQSISTSSAYPEQCASCLAFLGLACTVLPPIRAYLAQSITSLPRKRSNPARWFEPQLSIADSEQVRAAASRLAECIMLPSLCSAQKQGIAPAPLEAPDDITLRVFQHLISLMDNVAKVALPPNQPRTPCVRLVPYFRCITSTIREHAQSRLFEVHVGRMLPVAFRLFDQINNLRNECDYNKMELIKMLYTCASAYPSTLSLVTDATAIILMNSSIVTRQSKASMSYNLACLPPYYRLLLLLCRQSVNHTILLMDQVSISWAIETFVCSHDSYPLVAATLLEIIDLCLSHPECQPQAQTFRLKLVQMLLSDGTLSLAPNSSLHLFIRLMRDAPSLTATVLSSQEAINILVALIASPMPTGMQHQQQPHPSNMESCRTVAIDSLSCILSSAHTEGLTQSAKVALRAVPEPLKHSSVSMIFARLFNSACTAPVRKSSLQLLEQLSLLDDSCVNAVIQLAVTARSSATLTPNKLDTSRAGSGGSIAGGVDDVLWPAMRGIKGESTADEEYFRLMDVLCSEALSYAESCNKPEHMVRAVLLLLSCSLEALSAPEHFSARIATLVSQSVASGGDVARSTIGGSQLSLEWLRYILLRFHRHLLNDSIANCASIVACALAQRNEERCTAELVWICQNAVQWVNETAMQTSREGDADDKTASGAAAAKELLFATIALSILSSVPLLQPALAKADPQGQCIPTIRGALERSGAVSASKESKEACAKIDILLGEYAARMI